MSLAWWMATHTSVFKKQTNPKKKIKKKKKHPEMNLQWGKHWTLAIVSTQQTEVQIEILLCGNVADFINRTWHF